MSVGDVNGLTVLLTRAREDAEAWAVDLTERGARAVIFRSRSRVPRCSLLSCAGPLGI